MSKWRRIQLIMTNQLQFDLKEMDEEFTYGHRNVLKVSEIEKAGFKWHKTHAFCGDNRYGENEPMVSKTYLIETVYTIDWQDVPDTLKNKIISDIRNLNIKHVVQVYFGEIFCDPTDEFKKKNHIFVRGYRNNI